MYLPNPQTVQKESTVIRLRLRRKGQLSLIRLESREVVAHGALVQDHEPMGVASPTPFGKSQPAQLRRFHPPLKAKPCWLPVRPAPTVHSSQRTSTIQRPLLELLCGRCSNTHGIKRREDSAAFFLWDEAGLGKVWCSNSNLTAPYCLYRQLWTLGVK